MIGIDAIFKRKWPSEIFYSGSPSLFLSARYVTAIEVTLLGDVVGRVGNTSEMFP
jgi:hypothetical protein